VNADVSHRPPSRIWKGEIESVAAEPRRGAASPLIAVGIILFLAFVVVTVLVKRGTTETLDARLLQWAQTHLLDHWTRFWQAVSWPGYAPQSFGVAAIMVYLGWGYAGRRGLTLTLIALASQLLGTVLKHLVNHPRPTPESARIIGDIAHSASYPSGHVLTYTVILGLVALLIHDASPRGVWERRRDRALYGFFIALIVLVGPARVALGQHWPMDVAGAYLLGGATLALLARWRRPA
jgi:membrane-associated phospholipid phosphatase